MIAKNYIYLLTMEKMGAIITVTSRGQTIRGHFCLAPWGGGRGWMSEVIFYFSADRVERKDEKL